MDRTIYLFCSNRFPDGTTVEIIRQIAGTACYLVEVHCINDTAYATESELSNSGPDDSCDGWDYDR